MSPPGRGMYNRWKVPPVRVPELVACVFRSMDGHRSRVALQSSQSNKCCSLNNSGLDLRRGPWCWENTAHWYGLRAGGHDPDGGTIKKKMRGDDRSSERSPFSVLADRPPPLGVGSFQEEWTLFTSVIAHFPPTSGPWFFKKSKNFETVGKINYYQEFSGLCGISWVCQMFPDENIIIK